MEFEEVIQFWFKEIDPSKWFCKDPNFDALITQRFGDLHERAANGELSVWRRSSLGALAEVIVLDQFSRNMYRDSPKAFATDQLAIEASKQAIANGFEKELSDLSASHLSFLYMPFMHSESRELHETAFELFNKPGLEANYQFELKHKAIIDRFGRYPHRNEVLGRESTLEEKEFLKQEGSSF